MAPDIVAAEGNGMGSGAEIMRRRYKQRVGQQPSVFAERVRVATIALK
jgi:hypothetical protein